MNKDIPLPAFAPMYKSIDITHDLIWRKKSSQTFNGRQMVVTLNGMRCPQDPAQRVNTQEIALAVAMKLIELHKKNPLYGDVIADTDPDFLMESFNRGWLQTYMMIPLAKAIAKLAPVYKNEPFTIELKFQYFRKSLMKEHGHYVYDRTIVVNSFQGTTEQRTNVRRLADDKYTARFREHNFDR